MKVDQPHLESFDSNQELSAEIGFGKEVIAALEGLGLGHEAYIAGGFCRDLLLGDIPKDVDLATSATPEELLGLNIPGVQFKYIDAAEAYPVVQAIKDGMSLEVATFRQDEYENPSGGSRMPGSITLGVPLGEDAERRDLTVNALYYNPLTNQMTDPTGYGIPDIEAKLVRFVGNPIKRIFEDLVRILRAIRLKNKLGFEYAPETREALIETREEVLRIKSKVRVRMELAKMLVHPTRVEALKDMDDLGILELLIPEFTAGKGVEQPAQFHAEGDVFAHQLMVMENLPEHPSEHLVWAALLHDIGKPHIQTKDEDGRIRFNGHDEVSEILARKVMERMMFPNEDIEAVAWLVKNHMVVRNLPKMKRSKQLNMIQPHIANPSIKRADLFQDLLMLLKADNAASVRPDGSTDQESLLEAENIAANIMSEITIQKPTVKETFGIDGTLLMDLLGIERGDSRAKHLKSLIAYLNETFQDNPNLSKDDLLKHADEWWGHNA